MNGHPLKGKSRGNYNFPVSHNWSPVLRLLKAFSYVSYVSTSLCPLHSLLFMLSFNNQMLKYHPSFFWFLLQQCVLAFRFLSLYFPGVCISLCKFVPSVVYFWTLPFPPVWKLLFGMFNSFTLIADAIIFRLETAILSCGFLFIITSFCFYVLLGR